MFCSQCGIEAQATAKFCQKCGTPFTTHFLPTQPSKVAVGKAHAPQNRTTPEAVPVRPTPQPHPKHTTRQASPSSSESPSLWNPGAAASWSLLFTPVFGAYLHMRNWEELGEPEKAKSSKIWFYASIPFSIFFLGLPCLLLWYFLSGKEQMAYVKEKYGDNYNKKPWGSPIFVCILIFATFYALLEASGILGTLVALCVLAYAIGQKQRMSEAFFAAVMSAGLVSFGQGYILEKTKILAAKNSEANAVQQQAGENTAPKYLTDEDMGVSSSPNAVQQQPNFFDDPNDDGSPNYTPPPAANPYDDPKFHR